MVRVRKGLLVLIAAGALAGILALTVGPVSQNRALDEFLHVLQSAASAAGLPEPSERAAEMLANVLLFVPLGLAGGWLAPLRRAPWVVTGLGLLALLVEAVQYPVAGRDASLRDVLLNASGGVLGVVAAVLVRRTVRVVRTARASPSA